MHDKTTVREKPFIIRHWKWLIGIIGIMVILSVSGYFFIIYGGSMIIDDEDLILDEATTIEAADGSVLKKVYDENRTPVDIDKVPDHVQDAFVAIEDKRFFEHAGVDFNSVVRALSRDITAMEKTEGASTITQQLAKNISLQNDKTWLRKTKEVMGAIYLERTLSKDKILELYMNQMYFGHGVYGVEEASQYFFSKSAGDLSVAEGALLAGLAKSPNAHSPVDHPEKAKERRNVVLDRMDEMGAVSTDIRLKEQRKTLGLDIQKEKSYKGMESYIDMVTKEAAEKYQLSMQELKRGGYRIVSNVDINAQEIANDAFQQDDYFPGNVSGVEGSFVMMDHSSGAVVAALGGRDYTPGDLNLTTLPRQPGSAIKPLAVYGPAMMTDKFDAYSVIPDEEMEVDGKPVHNVDGQYDGTVSIYDALRESKNVPAVWLLNEIGIDNGKSYLKKTGTKLPDDGLSIALGGLRDGMTPLEMTKSYSSFANDGKAVEPYTISRIYDKDNRLTVDAAKETTDVYTPEVAWDMTKILMSVVQDGTAQAGDYAKELAGKTGTTEHPDVDGKVRDAWFMGYTPEYVTALWMGYADKNTDGDQYLEEGSSYPTALTKKILTEWDEEESLKADFEKPDYVDDLPDPIDLPEITNVEVSYTFGGLSLVKGKITWKPEFSGEGSNPEKDDRVIYRVYEKRSDEDKLVGKTEGENEYVIDDVSIFSSEAYYVVPYDPLTETEGAASDSVELSW